MEIKPIRSEADHEATLKEIEALWGSAPGSPEGDRLDILVTLAEAWEREWYSITCPDPIEALQFRLEQEGLDAKALVGVIGSRSRVHEILTYRRPLTLTMIRRLVERFDIPADVLIGAPRSRRSLAS